MVKKTQKPDLTDAQASREIDALRSRLQEAEELIEAIRHGEVDALVSVGSSGEEIKSLQGAERLYQRTVETMIEGALTLASDGLILYCNARFAELMQIPVTQLIGSRVQEFATAHDRPRLDRLLARARDEISKAAITLLRADKTPVPTLFVIRDLPDDSTDNRIVVVTDLSELEQTQTERDQLARIVDTTSVGIIGKTTAGVITSWNQGAQSLYGYAAAEMCGRSIKELVPPELKGEVDALIQRVAAGEIIEQYETQRMTKASGRVDVSLTLSPISDDDGTVIGVSTIAQDITARKRAESALKESEERFSSLLGNVQLVSVMLDNKSRITYCNDYFLNLVGRAREDVIGQNWIEHCIPPEHRADVRRTHTAMLAGEPLALHHENLILTQSGERRLIRWDNTVLRKADGQVVGSASIGSDITDYRRASKALKANELRFRRLIENNSDIIAVADPDGTVRFITPAVQKVAGYAPEELIGRDFLELLHPEDQEDALKQLASLAAHPEEPVRAERRYRHKDGSWLVMDLVGSNQLNTAGINGIVVTLHDITELKHKSWALGERVKEQHCLYQVSALAAQLRLSEEAFLRETSALLEAAVQYPQISCARVQLGNSSYASPDFVRTAWRIETDVSVDGRKEGTLELCYREEPPPADDGLFLAEEQTLLESVANILGRTLSAKRAQARLQLANIVIESSTSVLFRWQPGEGWPVVYVTDNVRQWGYESTDLLSGATPFASLIHPEDLPRIGDEVAAHLASGVTQFSQEYRILKPSGEVIWVDDQTSVERDPNGEPLFLQGVVTDITERKRDEGKIRASQQLIEGILNAMPVRVFWKDSNLVYLGCNNAFAHGAGYAEPGELVGKTDLDMPWGEQAEAYRADDLEVIDSGQSKLLIEESQTQADGRILPLLTSKVPLSDSNGQVYGVLGAFMDISEKKQAQEAVLRSEQKYRELFESSPDAIMTMFPPDWVFDSANQATLEMFGVKDAQAFAGLGPWDISPEKQPDGGLSADATKQMIETALREGSNLFEWEHCTIDGEPFPATVLLARVDIDGKTGLQATVRNISVQKEQERMLIRVNRALKTLSACNSAVVHAQSEDILLQNMCDLVVGSGYQMAWVGMAESDEGKTVRPVVWAGEGADYVQQTHITWAVEERGMGPTGRCIRSGEPEVTRTIADDPSMAPWHEQALKHGYQSGIALPLSGPSGAFGALMIYSEDANAFSSEEMTLLAELAGDLAYGITSLRTRTAHEQGLRELERSMEGTVQALASTVEMRDPYTAGHQRRVANMCVAMAREMGLSESRIKGLDLAASIHDIGKISIPAEILNKPGKLTQSEFTLIKEHAQAGYEILKDVSFPWPIADMIHQHHERIDGSGYPLGLKGDEILQEAKIMAVADTVEAMSSHRPYRPARGLDASLDQILEDRGTALDPESVDACITLFREKGYEMMAWAPG